MYSYLYLCSLQQNHPSLHHICFQFYKYILFLHNIYLPYHLFLINALDTWNSKLADIWTLVTQTPETFKGGTIWKVILNIHGGMQAIGLALLVLFFVIGVMKTCGSLTEVKKPEHALRLFIRFAIAKAIVTCLKNE